MTSDFILNSLATIDVLEQRNDGIFVPVTVTQEREERQCHMGQIHNDRPQVDVHEVKKLFVFRLMYVF